MTSEAAKQVKLGFWVAAGFWIFGIIVCVIVLFVLRSLRS